MPQGKTVRVEISFGELIDKLTILEIKAERLRDPGQLCHVRDELERLRRAKAAAVVPSAELDELAASLKEVNQSLWEIEDEIRRCERNADFGPRFVELARSVYRNNDRRWALKRRINELLGSELVEEKSYTDYSQRREPHGG
jgi:hypothetical protein